MQSTHTAFHHLQYMEKWEEPGIFISRDHDIIYKWQNNSERKSEVSCIAQPTTSLTLGVYNNHPLLATYMW